jgi:hypothetical protein
MSILPWRRTPTRALMIIPEEFDERLSDTPGARGTPIKWEDWQPSKMLQTAIESKDKESLLRAFRCCKSLFKKAYRELRRGRYRAATRYYVMAGYARTDFSTIERWGLESFEDNLARDVFNSNYSEVSPRDERKITEMLPPGAPCRHCGIMLARPQTVQGSCPNCNTVQTYAEKDRNRITARMARSMFGDGFKKQRERYRDPLAAYSEQSFLSPEWSPAVKELMSLVQPYL